MSSATTTPAAGDAIIASAQVFEQRNIIIGDDASFGDVSAGGDVYRQVFRVTALPSLRVSIFQYPQYDRGDFVFPARDYLSWRIVAVAAGRATALNNLVGEETGPPDVGPWFPVSTPQLMPVGQPISYTIPTGGYAAVAIEFDSTSGTPAVNEGYDRVLVTVSAGA